MSKKSDRNKEKKQKARDMRKPKYYDACTLVDTACQEEIRRLKTTGYTGVTSSLGVGEAICAIMHSSLDAVDVEFKVNTFIKFLSAQMSDNCLEIIPSENAKSEAEKIFKLLPRLDIADSLHFAVAIKNNCVSIVSGDPDFTGIPHNKIQDIKSAFGLSEFKIEKRDTCTL